MNKDLYLPNGLPIYKLMQYKTTGEKCQIIKVIPEKIDTTVDSENFGKVIYPLTVNIKINRITQGITHSVVVENILPYELVVWNESMNPRREVTYRTKKHQTRTVIYNSNN